MSKFKNKIFFALLFSSIFDFSYAQITSSDLAFGRKITETHVENLNEKKQRKAFFIFKVYKVLLSSQDIPNICRFNPSCSKFGLQQINKNGVFIGVLATFDRLTRCNGMQNEALYNYDRKSNLFEDNP